MLSRWFPHALAVIFAGFFVVLAIAPVSRQVWMAEVIPIIVIFAFLIWHYPRFRFSNTAYLLMSVWLFWHTVGGHYTFANVPFGWVNGLLDSDRNHFDRIGHFTVGFYAFAMAEWLLRRGHCRYLLANFFALFFIMAVAAAYEIIEWWYAATEGGEAGIEFLGSQGDIWDAQRDMLADMLGAVFSLLLFAWLRPDRKNAAIQPSFEEASR